MDDRSRIQKESDKKERERVMKNMRFNFKRKVKVCTYDKKRLYKQEWERLRGTVVHVETLQARDQ